MKIKEKDQTEDALALIESLKEQLCCEVNGICLPPMSQEQFSLGMAALQQAKSFFWMSAYYNRRGD